MSGPQLGIGAGGPVEAGLAFGWGARVAIPGLRIETGGTRMRPENFGSSSFSQVGVEGTGQRQQVGPRWSGVSESASQRASLEDGSEFGEGV